MLTHVTYKKDSDVRPLIPGIGYKNFEIIILGADGGLGHSKASILILFSLILKLKTSHRSVKEPQSNTYKCRHFTHLQAFPEDKIQHLVALIII